MVSVRSYSANLANINFFFVDIDPVSWKFHGREVYDRRVYFWNLLAGSLWTVGSSMTLFETGLLTVTLVSSHRSTTLYRFGVH